MNSTNSTENGRYELMKNEAEKILKLLKKQRAIHLRLLAIVNSVLTDVEKSAKNEVDENAILKLLQSTTQSSNGINYICAAHGRLFDTEGEPIGTSGGSKIKGFCQDEDTGETERILSLIGDDDPTDREQLASEVCEDTNWDDEGKRKG